MMSLLKDHTVIRRTIFCSLDKANLPKQNAGYQHMVVRFMGNTVHPLLNEKPY